MAAVMMEDASLGQPAEAEFAGLQLQDLEMAYKMQLHEVLLASANTATQKGIPAEIDNHTREMLDFEVETQEQQEVLRRQTEELSGGHAYLIRLSASLLVLVVLWSVACLFSRVPALLENRLFCHVFAMHMQN